MRLPGILAFLDDRMNPIVVKELRQAVNSRFVVAVLLVFLLLQLSVFGIYLVTTGMRELSRAADLEAGRGIFLVLQGILLAVCMLFLPAYTGMRLAAERSDANVDLLFITTLRPRGIIAGKLLSSLLIGLLIFSACAPFMTFSYLLRGLSIPTILIVMAIDFLVVAASIMLAILIAILPFNRLFKIILGLAFLAGLCMLFGATISGTTALVMESAALLDDVRFWGPMLALGLLAALTIGLLFCSAVALVSPPTSNRALPVRIYLVFLWLVMAAAFGLVDYAIATGEVVGGMVWLCIMVSLFSLNLILVGCERDHWTPRTSRMIPRNPLLRFLAFLFYSGSAGGVLFSCLMIALTMSLAFAWIEYLPSYLGRTAPSWRDSMVVFRCMGTIALYTFAYAQTAILLRLTVLRQLKPVLTWVLTLLLAVFGSTLPFLAGFLLLQRDWRFDEHYFFLLPNPIAGVYAVIEEWHSVGPFFLAFVACWGAAAALLSLPWLIGQALRFRPLER